MKLVSILIPAALLLTAAGVPAQVEHHSPEDMFEEVWETFDRGYALFGVKSIDWQALHDTYRPRVSAETTEEELFELLTAMLACLNDTHVMVSATTLGRDFSAGYHGPMIAEKGLQGALEFLHQRPLPQRYFSEPPATAGGGTYQYGWVGNGIGYVHFYGFDDVAGSARAMDEILAALEGARAFVVDVRNNSGGDDRVGKVIADRFADTRRLYMVTRDRNGPGHDDFADPKYWHVDPAENAFTGPVILLTSRYSVSAAENFALAMRVLPHVTVVGDTTSGCFADMKWFDLPNGWRYSISRNLFVDYNGKCWEGIGVPPDVLVPGRHRQGDTDRAMDRALVLLEGNGPPKQDESASAAAARPR